MERRVQHARHHEINKVLKYVGLSILLLAVLGALLDLIDWNIRKTTSSVSSYSFTGHTIIFSGMTNGDIDVTAGDTSKVTIVYRLSEGIRKLHVSEEVRGSTFIVQESGGCNNKLSLELFGNCTSQYQVQVPANTTIVANAKNASISVDGVNGNHQLETDKGTITLENVTAQSLITTTNDGTISLGLLGSPNDVKAHSNEGDVHIRLQNTATAYKVSAASPDGRTKVDVKTDRQNSQNIIAASSNKGDVSVTY